MAKRVVLAGMRLARWREHRGMSIRSLGAKADVCKSTLQRIEAGHAEPRADLIQRVVAALDITLDEFYGPLPRPPRSAS